MSPPSRIPLPPPSYPSHLIALGCPRAPALGVLLHASNSHWLSILYMVMYTFRCNSLKSSHPLLLPLSPKVYSLCLCLLCCPASRIVDIICFDVLNCGACPTCQGARTRDELPPSRSPQYSNLNRLCQVTITGHFVRHLSHQRYSEVNIKHQIRSDQSLSHVQLFATP